ncbi:pathogenicity island protein [Lysinibacillus sp. NPDC093688]|uniref:pathogenicity island protein n=1 Tax=Lysinibacillus sp. NPDC093688 TaxID=3390577 RepID=UPI003D060119
MTIKQKLLNYIETHSGTSFVEIERLFEENHFHYEGDQSLQGDTNLILWLDWNDEAVALINELLEEGSIICKTIHLIAYIADGGSIPLPIAKETRAYHSPRWLPVAFYYREAKG